MNGQHKAPTQQRNFEAYFPDVVSSFEGKTNTQNIKYIRLGRMTNTKHNANHNISPASKYFQHVKPSVNGSAKDSKAPMKNNSFTQRAPSISTASVRIRTRLRNVTVSINTIYLCGLVKYVLFWKYCSLVHNRRNTLVYIQNCVVYINYTHKMLRDKCLAINYLHIKDL